MMFSVNLYVYSSVKRPNQHQGTVVYILEMPTSKGSATFTNKLSLEDTTPNGSVLQGIYAALGHITKPSQVKIYTTNRYIYRGINDLLPKWQKNGYKTSKNKPICHQKKWRLTEDFLCIEGLIATLEDNTYLEWMKREAEDG
ncbi:MAG: hypothetical protein KBT06_11080 [Prevotellaceae bacterium]|nr:hypothetical protein [Candidatus Colivivens equi]